MHLLPRELNAAGHPPKGATRNESGSQTRQPALLTRHGTTVQPRREDLWPKQQSHPQSRAQAVPRASPEPRPAFRQRDCQVRVLLCSTQSAQAAAVPRWASSCASSRGAVRAPETRGRPGQGRARWDEGRVRWDEGSHLWRGGPSCCSLN